MTALDRVLSADDDPLPALADWLASAQRTLERGGFECGCPLATVALESTASDVQLRAALADAFAAVRNRLADVLHGAGMPAQRAAGLAALTVATYQGSLMQARVAGSVEPMAQACATLLDLVEREIRTSEDAR